MASDRADADAGVGAWPERAERELVTAVTGYETSTLAIWTVHMDKSLANGQRAPRRRAYGCCAPQLS
jgi:hypothetical protein